MNSNCEESNSDSEEISLQSRFLNYRREKKFTDVKIKVGDSETEAHRMVLEEYSPVFKSMLADGKNILEFDKENVDPNILEDLLDFIYEASIQITESNAISMFIASNYLDIPALKKECEKVFSYYLIYENVPDIYFLSIKYEVENLRKMCEKHIIAEGKRISENENLLSLNLEQIQKIKNKKLRLEDHRKVLEDASPLIKKLLENLKNEENILRFKEKNVDPEIFEKLTNIIYEVRIDITEENAFALFHACNFFNLPNLQWKCESFLLKICRPKNIVDLYLFSLQHALKRLITRCEDFIAVEGEKVFDNEKLLGLDFKMIKFILEKMKIGNKNNQKLKKKMFRFAITWAENDFKNREFSLTHLFKLIPIHELPTEFFEKYILQHPRITNSWMCLKYINVFLKKDSHDSILYCLGTDKCFLQMMTSDGNWKNLPTDLHLIPDSDNKEYSNTEFRATLSYEKIYVFRNNEDSWMHKSPTNYFHVFDCENETWNKLAPSNYSYSHFGITSLYGEIYISGGKNLSTEPTGSRIMQKYCVQTNEWKQLKEMIHSRSYHKLIVLNDKIYAIGGTTPTSNECYDPFTDVWSKVEPCQIHHNSEFSSTSHFNKIYVFSSKGFEVFNPFYNIWNVLPSPHRNNWGSQLVSMNGKLLLIGGKNRKNMEESKKILEFDVVKNFWKELPHTDPVQNEHTAMVLDF